MPLRIIDGATVDVTNEVRLGGGLAYDSTNRELSSTATGSSSPVVSTPSYSASMSLDWSGVDEMQITLTGNLDIAAMSNGVAGKRYILTLRQDASGSRTLSVSATNVRFSDDIASLTLSTTGSRIDRIGFIYDGADSKFDVVAFNKGFH